MAGLVGLACLTGLACQVGLAYLIIQSLRAFRRVWIVGSRIFGAIFDSFASFVRFHKLIKAKEAQESDDLAATTLEFYDLCVESDPTK